MIVTMIAVSHAVNTLHEIHLLVLRWECLPTRMLSVTCMWTYGCVEPQTVGAMHNRIHLRLPSQLIGVHDARCLSLEQNNM